MFLPHLRPRRLGALLLSAGALALGACGGDGDDPPTTPPPTPTITVAAAPTAVTVTQGQSATSTLTLTRGGNYAGAVALATSGAPAGLTVTLTPTSLTGATLSSAIGVAAAATTAPGSYPITVTATGSGVSNSTATLTVNVVAAPTPTVTLAVAPTSLTATAGGAAVTATVTIVRGGGFAGPVELSVEGAPANVAVTPATTTVAAGATTATVTVTAAGTAAPGTATLTLRARAQGVADATTTLALTVAPPAQTGAFTLAVAPNALSIVQGASGATRATIARSGGFAGGVAITASGGPQGITVTAPASIAGDTATLAVAVASTVAPGSYTLTLTGTGAGVANQTATLAVTVTAAPVASVALTLAPTSVSVVQGATATTTVNLARTNFTGAVALAATSAQAGITATVAPASATGATATLTVSVAATVPAGSYPVTVTGTAAGLTAQTATLTVQVTSAGSGGGNNRVTFNFACERERPIWVAAQSESGAWTRVTGTNDVYAFNVGARGGIAYVTQSGSTYDLTVVYGSAAELGTGGSNVCATLPARGTKRLTGTVAGLGATDLATISLGTDVATVAPGQSTTFTLDSLPEGRLTLGATRSSLGESGIVPNRIILRRGVNYPNNSAIPTLDFNGTEAFAPASATLTLANLGTDDAIVSTGLFTGAFAFGGFASSFGEGSQLRYYGLPTDRLEAGELHFVSVSAFSDLQGGGGDATTFRSTATFVRTITDRTLTLPPNLSTPTVSAAATAPYLRPRATLPVQSEYASGVTIGYSQTDRFATVSVTPGYLGSATTWDVSIPDLTAAGFDPTWGLRGGARTMWSVTAFGGFAPGLGGLPTEGTLFRFAARTGTIAGTAQLSADRRLALTRATLVRAPLLPRAARAALQQSARQLEETGRTVRRAPALLRR